MAWAVSSTAWGRCGSLRCRPLASHTLKPDFVSSCEHLDLRISRTADPQKLCKTYFGHCLLEWQEVIVRFLGCCARPTI